MVQVVTYRAGEYPQDGSCILKSTIGECVEVLGLLRERLQKSPNQAPADSRVSGFAADSYVAVLVELNEATSEWPAGWYPVTQRMSRDQVRDAFERRNKDNTST